MKNEIQMIRIDHINILNPRSRDQRKFEVIVESIREVGLKKPIQVSLRSVKDGEEPGYDLVCGQGRMEACRALGHTEIPAEVVEISKTERMLKSLVENIARRTPSPFALIHEIMRLREDGKETAVIAKSLGIAESMVRILILLKNNGEERLLEETLRGYVPVTVAIEISKAESVEAQRELLKIYEGKELPQDSIRAIRRLVMQRQTFGKSCNHSKIRNAPKTAEGMMAAYRQQCQKQKIMIKKAQQCDSTLVLLAAAFRELIKDEDFINLLKAEQMPTMPVFLAEKITNGGAI